MIDEYTIVTIVFVFILFLWSQWRPLHRLCFVVHVYRDISGIHKVINGASARVLEALQKVGYIFNLLGFVFDEILLNMWSKMRVELVHYKALYLSDAYNYDLIQGVPEVRGKM